MHLVRVLTATQGQDCSQAVSWTPEPSSELPQLQHIGKEQAYVKILQPSMLDKDSCQQPVASDPKYV